jgi:hypothetical protein
MAVNESIDNLTLCLPDKGLLLHPYGGGVDCFFDDAAERARVANVFSANLSKRADGL